MPSVAESRDVDEDKLEDLLQTIPLLKPVASTSSFPPNNSSSPFDVAGVVVGNKPNAIVRPIPRLVVVKENPPVQDVVLPELESQIQRHENGSGNDTRRYLGSVPVIPKRKLVPMDPLLQKPLFITTVPTGVFLEKTHEAPPARKMYNYSSAPRVLRSTDTQSFLSKVSNATKKSFFTSSSENKSQKGSR